MYPDTLANVLSTWQQLHSSPNNRESSPGRGLNMVRLRGHSSYARERLGRERTTRGQGFRRITSRNNSSMTASVVRAWGYYANICHGENSWDTVLDCWVPTPLLESFGLVLTLTLCKAHSVSCPLLLAVHCCRLAYPLRSSSFVAWRVKYVWICQRAQYMAPLGGVRICKCIVPLQIEFALCYLSMGAQTMLFCKRGSIAKADLFKYKSFISNK